MEKNIYIVRHCQAEGQSPEAALTDKGLLQAKELADFFRDIKTDRIISTRIIARANSASAREMRS